ncbi:MAG: tRNA pseudouridine(55) synthase TruB [Desulfobacterales bacterium]
MDVSAASGIIVLDKPAGMSSARAVAAVKRMVNARKVGHAGTLDPFATGVLVCCLNQATRLAQFFLHGPKKYHAVMHLGIETDTQDVTGRVVASSATAALDPERVVETVRQFEGAYWQQPPAYSALKLGGVPLYRYARAGHAVQKPPRRVEIGAIRIIDTELPFVRFEVDCSAGTYIRTLCADIGRRLGCGGHLRELRRLASGRFGISDAVTLPDLEVLTRENRLAQRVVAMADALPEIPGIVANKSLTHTVKHGRVVRKCDVNVRGAEGPRDLVKILDAHGNLLAIIKGDDDHDTFGYVCVFSPAAG